jgi:hypothetical protein
MVRRSEEVERLGKEKEKWNKEKDLSKEEYVTSWTRTIEALEKIYKGFYSYKDFKLGKFKPEPVWTCDDSYKDEDKTACKKDVMRILNLCKKEDVLINRPAVANLIYVNRLNKRETTNKDDVMEEPMPRESLPEVEDIKEGRLNMDVIGSTSCKEKEEELVASGEEKKSDDTTVEPVVCDQPNTENNKEVIDKTTSNVILPEQRGIREMEYLRYPRIQANP